MAKQTITTGVTPNDGLGDTLRNGAQKINENFTEVYNNIGTLQTDLDAAEAEIVSITNTIATTIATVAYVDAEISSVSNTILNLIDSDNQTLNLVGNTLSISNGNSVDLSSLQTDLTGVASIVYVDATANNLLSTINGTIAALQDSDNQQLSFNSNTAILSISNGNFVDLSLLAGSSGTSNSVAYDQSLNTTDDVIFNKVNIEGELVFPDTTTQTTAYPGPQPAQTVQLTANNTFDFYRLIFADPSADGAWPLYYDTGGPTWVASSDQLQASSIAALQSFVAIDGKKYTLGNNSDASFFYDGTANKLNLELEEDATAFIITDNGTPKFTFDKATGQLTADSFVSTAAGTPTITSATDIVLDAANRVRIDQAPIMFGKFTTLQRDALVAQAGDVIFNTTDSKFQGFDGTNWVNFH